MSRKSLILCICALAVMTVGVGIAVLFLYSGSGTQAAAEVTSVDEDRYSLLAAVPSDAVAVFCFSDCREVEYPFADKVLMAAAGSAKAVMSLHYSAELVPLYVFDVGKASEEMPERAGALIEAASAAGLHAQYLDCTAFTGLGRHLSSHALVLVSPLENIVNSSVRHLEKGVSVLDSPGFTEAALSLSSDDVAFVSLAHSRRLVPAVLSKKYSGRYAFLSRFCDWIAVDTDDPWELEGRALYDRDKACFMSVLDAMSAEHTTIASVLPAHVLTVFTMPVADVSAYTEAYGRFVDSRQGLPKMKQRQKELEKAAGMSPEAFVAALQISEVAKASFKVRGKVESVNLMKMAKKPSIGFADSVAVFPYSGFTASVFGDFFALEDEGFSVRMDNWLVTGSRNALAEISSEAVREYTLKDKIADSGNADMFARTPVLAMGYMSFTEDRDELKNMLSGSFLSGIEPVLGESPYCPLVFKVVKDKKGTRLLADLVRTEVKRSKAPAVERDTVVIVPEGPFAVKNSGTGKMNEFYQNSHLSLCLREEGKDLWGVPFKEKLCGTAQTVDFYANGKLQILFGAGSRMYLIDRLGRFVKGFPVSLGKDILLGPQPYDFNGNRRYNVMVLHKDNTLEMYNMKGARPEGWRGIKAPETVKALPELVKVGGQSFWIVRTSIQTLVYPFMGGEPVTVFEGDRKIRPDSAVTVVDDSSVEVECYDGSRRTVRLKQ